MPTYDLASCPAAIADQVRALVAGLASGLDGLVGVYLHGSLAMGCCNPQRSDLDVLAIAAGPMGLPPRRALAELFLACSGQPLPLEVSVLAWGQLWPWRYPTLYDMHYSERWRATFAADLASGAWRGWAAPAWGDPDLAAHVTVARARGVCLWGMPIGEALPPVPAEHYRAALSEDIGPSLDAITGDPVYAILNCCRSYAYLREGHVFSKEEGGLWALGALPSHREVVEAALDAYRLGAGAAVAGDLPGFAAAMRLLLAPLLAGGAG